MLSSIFTTVAMRLSRARSTEAVDFDALLSDAISRGFSVAFRWLGDKDAARDACQEAAMRAWASRQRYQASRPFYPWYYIILRNHCRDLLKRRQRLQPLREPPLVHPEVERRLIEGEEERALLASIQALEPSLRQMIELRHFQEMSYREMAAVVGCPEGTVMSRLYRARKALREALLEKGGLR